MQLRRIFTCLLGVVISGNLLGAQDSDRIIDTRGPVQNVGMTVQVDHEGVQAPGYVGSKPEAKQAWMAQWIGCSAPAVPDSNAVCLRKELTLTQQPKKVTAWINSDTYLLYVNGHLVARGPADAGHDFQGVSSGHRFYDCRDFTPFFHAGQNVVAVELTGGGGFQFEARVDYPDGSSQILQTDETWKGIPSPYLKMSAIPAEDEKVAGKGQRPLFEATAEPIGWMLTGFDDSSWPACKAGTPPAGTLVLNELPPLMEVRYPYFEISRVMGDVTIPAHPFQEGQPIVVTGNGSFAVHFDKIMSGRCGIKVRGCQGAVIYLASNETNTPGGRVYQLHLRDGWQYFESRDYYALGTVNVTVKNAAKPVEIMDVSADFLSQPVEYTGSFTCSDEALNTLWKSGRWSTQICMITHHLDSPQHQEPISDYGDYLIEDLVNFNTMGNPALARQDLRKWAWVMENARYRTFHTSYIFYWLQALLNYYDYTGDKSLVQELAPNVHAVIDQFSSYLGQNGLISEAPNYMFMDWVTVHDHRDPAIKFACHHPPAVIGQGYMTALFYRALGDAIRVSRLTNDSTDVEKYEKLRQQVADAYQRELWNPEQGEYRDGKPFATSVPPNKWLPADVAMESFSVQNNAIAVLHDLAPADKRGAILETALQDKNGEVTPYYMHFVFDALAHAGLFDRYGVPKMHEYQVVPETQTVREMGIGKGDFSHGWIASPTYQMSSKILGIVPTSSRFDTFAIHPTLCQLDYARGAVPSPHGLIEVDWQRKQNQLTLKVTIPPGTRADVALPIGSAPEAVVTSAGKTLWEKAKPSEAFPGLSKISRGASTIDMELEPGRYEFVVSNLLSVKA